VNIVTRTGGEDHQFYVRADKDNILPYTEVSKTNDFEASASGPVVAQKLYYTAAGRGVLNDTRWWQDMQLYFASPIEKNWSAFAKLDYLATPPSGWRLRFSTRGATGGTTSSRGVTILPAFLPSTGHPTVRPSLSRRPRRTSFSTLPA